MKTLQTTLWRFWSARAPREQQALRVGSAVLLLGLLWGVLLGPAWRDLQRLPQQHTRLAAEWSHMQQQDSEAQALQAATPLAHDQAHQAVQAASLAFTRRGAARLIVQGDQATLQFEQLSGAELAQWLREVRQAARARPVQADWTPQGAGYRGRVVLALSSPTP